MGEFVTFGVIGSVDGHRYMQPVQSRSRRRCPCCKARATHMGMNNGVGLIAGCELRVRRWVRDGRQMREARSLAKLAPMGFQGER